MTVPSVTTVVPTRDRPELLRAAIDAILNQQYAGHVDVVVVYDQSEPDHGLERAEQHRRVRVISNDRSPGLAGARNTGILTATGDLVAFCDDDDEWLPGKLAAQVSALTAAGQNAEFVATGIRVSYDGSLVDRVLPIARVPLQALLRSDEKIPGSYAEDYEFLLRAARRVPLVNLTEPYVLVRWHKRSYFSQRWQTIADALQWLLGGYPEFSTEPRGAARVTGQIAFAHAALGHHRHAIRWVGRTLRRNPREPRAYLALVVASRAVRPDTIVRRLHERGRGI
jgi:glycosyltransferase involved in cell wall biosynthesis